MYMCRTFVVVGLGDSIANLMWGTVEGTEQLTSS